MKLHFHIYILLSWCLCLLPQTFSLIYTNLHPCRLHNSAFAHQKVPLNRQKGENKNLKLQSRCIKKEKRKKAERGLLLVAPFFFVRDNINNNKKNIKLSREINTNLKHHEVRNEHMLLCVVLYKTCHNYEDYCDDALNHD